MAKELRLSEALLSKEQLEDNLAKMAANNNITKKSSYKTYPINRLKDNCKYIFLVYKLLEEHTKINIPIHPAGEWILDNYYIIEKAAKTVSKELTVSKYKKLPGVAKRGFARIYVVANEIISKTDGKITGNDLEGYLRAYQTQKFLTMEEIWNIGLFLQVVLIEKIRKICEKILVSQVQKMKAKNILDILIENKILKKIDYKVEEKYAFVEFMSYQLRKYGKKSIPYLKALEEEVNKTGLTVDEAIRREHFDIAVKTVSMKNSITSLKTISRIDITPIFKKINKVESILEKDPANVYKKMDHKTKEYYRSKIIELSEKTKISEIFIAEKIINLCKEGKRHKKEKESHVGFFLIDEGKKDLIMNLLNKKIHFVTFKEKENKYISSIYLITTLIFFLIAIPIKWNTIFLYIPIQNAVTRTIQFILNKKGNNRIIPKLDFSKGIPREYATMCIVPILLKNKIDVEKIAEKIEIYYLANRSENLFFTILGDCKESSKEKEEIDLEIKNKGVELTNRLNNKYGEKFFFLYRKREWSESEKCFMGWERKRGLITQFNEFIKTGKSKFDINTMHNIPKIKYIITLDSDTNLTLNSAQQLVGAMSHILNKPEVDNISNTVIKGHAIIQPRIGTDIEYGRKTIFSRLFAGNGGTDIYSNAISDVYQDGFDEGIFIGKGIYDLDVFYKVLKDKIPENLVLSHDLLEGSYLRCGLASDIVLLDGYPSRYDSYKKRNHRWIRGDVQIIGWLKSGLNTLSKYKIIDNIIRNLNEKDILLSFLLLMITTKSFLLVPFIIYLTPTIVKLIDYVINKKYGTIKDKLFAKKFSKCKHMIYKSLIEIIAIPDTALLQMDAIGRSLYRMKISHNSLLEWITSEEAENESDTSYFEYMKNMNGELIIALLMIIYYLLNCNKFNLLNRIVIIVLAILWSSSSIIMWVISREEKTTKKIKESNKKYLLDISKKTWNYFKDNLINNLPVDNYQQNRNNMQAKRTSPTNIGLFIISAIASCDLKLENINNTIQLIKETIEVVDKLAKWNGHLYNWYDLDSLEPIHPYDISSVDSGNFVGYLYIAKQFLFEYKKDYEVDEIVEKIDLIIENTDFQKLYSYENGLFSIGFSVEQNKLYDAYYDLLASEARQTSIIAIAKKDIPAKHWSNLGRTLTIYKGHRGLVSWGGTVFEYLMPNINIPTFQSTLLDESCKLLLLCNKEYGQKLNTPWGMSEAAYSLKDLYGNYQYKTFGIPWLGLKRGLEEEIVVSPYSSGLMMMVDAKESIHNLKKLQKEGMIGEYGFYDSIDYKPKKEIVKTYMAHHQGMIMASIDNALNNNIIQQRFMRNPEMQGIRILLQENMPEDVILTKKNKIKKVKYKEYGKCSPRNEGINIISSNELINMTSSKGKGYTQFEDKTIYKDINIYIKNINSNKIYDFNEVLSNRRKKSKVEFLPSESKLTIEDGTVKSTIRTTIAPDKQVEIRKISIENKGISEVNLEINTFTEPILMNKMDYSAHPAFNKMFFKYEYQEPKLVITKKAKGTNEKTIHLVTTLYSKDGKPEFEIDKEKYISRNNEQIPAAVRDSKQLSQKIETVINPVIAFRQLIKIPPGEEKELYLISSVNCDKEKAINDLDFYCDYEKADRVFELKKEQCEAENRYLGINEKEIALYQDIARMLMYTKQEAFEKLKKEKYNISSLDLSNKRLWKFGISGEMPLIVVKIGEHYDKEFINEILKAYEYIVSKKIKTELVIITNNEIKQKLINDRTIKYLNKRGGIFVLDNLKYDEIKIFEYRANVLLDSNDGNLTIQIDELKKEKKKRVKKVLLIYENKEDYNEGNYIETDFLKLDYENEYGSFNKDGNEYWIRQNNKKRVPIAWSNILANKNFGTIITENQGGFTWYNNSQTNKITKFENDAYTDNPSEKIVVKGYENNEGEYYTGVGFGYMHSVKKANKIEQKITTFVPLDNSLKINILQIKNNKDEEVELDIKYDVKLLMGQNENNSIIVEKYKKNLNMILFNNLMHNDYTVYITSNAKIDKNKELHLNLKPKELREIVLIIGAEKTEMQCLEVSAKYINSYKHEFEKTREYWKRRVSKVKSKTPMKSFDIMQNGFLVYQTLASRMLGRTGYYQSSGGYGFRDQLQDSLGMKWIDPNILKEQIMLHSRHQFFEGDVEHWWHEDSELGIKARYSDDLLWLVYAVEEYIDFTGDYSILKEKERFVKAKPLSNNEIDRVDYYKNYSSEESIFNHCLKALHKSLNLGKHNLPLMQHGDWNDGMNKVGEQGKGESVWLGFFLYMILKSFIDILDYMENNDHKTIISKELEIEINQNGNKKIKPTSIDECLDIDYKREKEKFKKIASKIKKSLNTFAWDGRWYLRAFNDNNEKIGSITNEECKIDSISQSFSVISDAGDNDKKHISMTSLENNLIDNENNIVKLLTPALENTDLGYISSYPRGIRENGGQYTHAAIWAIIAEALLNKPEKAMDIYKKINPIEHTKSEDGIIKYKVEPYVVEADIYSEGSITGRGGWTWYTGASSWLYEAQIKYILGINIYHRKMKIMPCVPKDWKKFNVDFNWKNASYHIEYNQIGEYKIDTEDLKIEDNNMIKLRGEGDYIIKVYF